MANNVKLKSRSSSEIPFTVVRNGKEILLTGKPNPKNTISKAKPPISKPQQNTFKSKQSTSSLETIVKPKSRIVGAISNPSKLFSSDDMPEFESNETPKKTSKYLSNSKKSTSRKLTKPTHKKPIHYSAIKPSNKQYFSNAKSTPSSRWKSFLVASVAIASGVLLYTSLNNDSQTFAKMTDADLAAIPKSTRNEMITIAHNPNIASRKNLSVDEDLIEKSIAIFDTMSYEQIVKSAKIYGLPRDYSGLSVGKHVDFKKGFKFMWDRKLKMFTNKGLASSFEVFALNLVNDYLSSTPIRSSLKEHSSSLEKTLNTYKSDFKMDAFCSNFHGKKINSEKNEFMRNYFEHINSQIMLAYSTTELYLDINPVVNLLLYNEHFKQGGIKSVYFGTVASGDMLNSFGPGQLTKHAVNKDIVKKLKPYFPSNYDFPQSMEDIDTQEKYDLATFSNIVNNISLLASYLYSTNTLESFNDIFNDLSDDDQSLLVSGTLSAMNYRPFNVKKGVANYVDESKAGRVKKEDIVNSLWVGVAQSYYDKSVKNTLVLTYLDF